MVRRTQRKTDKKSHARSWAFSWMLYLILISCSLTSVTLSKYVKTVNGSASITIAAATMVLTGAGVNQASRSIGGNIVALDELSEQSDCIFEVQNYNEAGEITEVEMNTTIRVEGVDGFLPDFELYETDSEGNISVTAMEPNLDGSYTGKQLSTDVKQHDVYVIKFTGLPEPGVSLEVTVIAEQVIEEG